MLIKIGLRVHARPSGPVAQGVAIGVPVGAGEGENHLLRTLVLDVHRRGALSVDAGRQLFHIDLMLAWLSGRRRPSRSSEENRRWKAGESAP